MSEKVSALQIEYSTVCNMKHLCTHCYGATGVLNENQTISDDVMEVILREAKLIAESITITGGEPACFPEIVKRISLESELPIMLMTNGLEYVEGVHPHGVLFSLDPPDVRLLSNVDSVIKNVERYECNLACNTVLSRELDIFDYYEILKKLNNRLYGRELEVLEWKLGFIIKKGKARSNKSIQPNLENMFKKLQDFLVVYFKEQPFPLAVRGFLYTSFLEERYLNSVENFKVNQTRNPCLDCFGRGEILTINTSGCVQLCTTCREVSVPIGKSLIDAVNKLIAKDEISTYTYNDWKDCQDCKYFNLCACGCPSLAMTYGNLWQGKDLFQCEIMEKWEQYIVPILPAPVREVYENALK